MLWWARWFTTNLECALFWGQKPLPLMGATRPASEKIQLLFSRVRIIPPFSIPTRDASPPLVLAFFATKPVSFLMPILNPYPPGLPPLIPLNIYCRDNSLISLSRSYTILRPPLCRRPCVGRPWRALCKANLPQPLLHSHLLGSATAHPARSARWGGAYPYGRGTPV